MAYARRWQIEVMWKTCKSELGMQSPRVWDWESRLKLLGLASARLCLPAASAQCPFQALASLVVALCGSSHWQALAGDAGAAGALAPGVEPLVVGLSPGIRRRARPGLAVS